MSLDELIIGTFLSERTPPKLPWMMTEGEKDDRTGCYPTGQKNYGVFGRDVVEPEEFRDQQSRDTVSADDPRGIVSKEYSEDVMTKVALGQLSLSTLSLGLGSKGKSTPVQTKDENKILDVGFEELFSRRTTTASPALTSKQQSFNSYSDKSSKQSSNENRIFDVGFEEMFAKSPTTSSHYVTGAQSSSTMFGKSSKESSNENRIFDLGFEEMFAKSPTKPNTYVTGTQSSSTMFGKQSSNKNEILDVGFGEMLYRPPAISGSVAPGGYSKLKQPLKYAFPDDILDMPNKSFYKKYPNAKTTELPKSSKSFLDGMSTCDNRYGVKLDPLGPYPNRAELLPKQRDVFNMEGETNITGIKSITSPIETAYVPSFLDNKTTSTKRALPKLARPSTVLAKHSASLGSGGYQDINEKTNSGKMMNHIDCTTAVSRASAPVNNETDVHNLGDAKEDIDTFVTSRENSKCIMNTKEEASAVFTEIKPERVGLAVELEQSTPSTQFQINGIADVCEKRCVNDALYKENSLMQDANDVKSDISLENDSICIQKDDSPYNSTLVPYESEVHVSVTYNMDTQSPSADTVYAPSFINHGTSDIIKTDHQKGGPVPTHRVRAMVDENENISEINVVDSFDSNTSDVLSPYRKPLKNEFNCVDKIIHMTKEKTVLPDSLKTLPKDEDIEIDNMSVNTCVGSQNGHTQLESASNPVAAWMTRAIESDDSDREHASQMVTNTMFSKKARSSGLTRCKTFDAPKVNIYTEENRAEVKLEVKQRELPKASKIVVVEPAKIKRERVKKRLERSKEIDLHSNGRDMGSDDISDTLSDDATCVENTQVNIKEPTDQHKSNTKEPITPPSIGYKKNAPPQNNTKKSYSQYEGGTKKPKAHQKGVVKMPDLQHKCEIKKSIVQKKDKIKILNAQHKGDIKLRYDSDTNDVTNDIRDDGVDSDVPSDDELDKEIARRYKEIMDRIKLLGRLTDESTTQAKCETDHASGQNIKLLKKSQEPTYFERDSSLCTRCKLSLARPLNTQTEIPTQIPGHAMNNALAMARRNSARYYNDSESDELLYSLMEIFKKHRIIIPLLSGLSAEMQIKALKNATRILEEKAAEEMSDDEELNGWENDDISPFLTVKIKLRDIKTKKSQKNRTIWKFLKAVEAKRKMTETDEFVAEKKVRGFPKDEVDSDLEQDFDRIEQPDILKQSNKANPKRRMNLNCFKCIGESKRTIDDYETGKAIPYLKQGYDIVEQHEERDSVNSEKPLGRKMFRNCNKDIETNKCIIGIDEVVAKKELEGVKETSCHLEYGRGSEVRDKVMNMKTKSRMNWNHLRAVSKADQDTIVNDVVKDKSNITHFQGEATNSDLKFVHSPVKETAKINKVIKIGKSNGGMRINNANNDTSAVQKNDAEGHFSGFPNDYKSLDLKHEKYAVDKHARLKKDNTDKRKDISKMNSSRDDDTTKEIKAGDVFEHTLSGVLLQKRTSSELGSMRDIAEQTPKIQKENNDKSNDKRNLIVVKSNASNTATKNTTPANYIEAGAYVPDGNTPTDHSKRSLGDVEEALKLKKRKNKEPKIITCNDGNGETSVTDDFETVKDINGLTAEETGFNELQRHVNDDKTVKKKYRREKTHGKRKLKKCDERHKEPNEMYTVKSATDVVGHSNTDKGSFLKQRHTLVKIDKNKHDTKTQPKPGMKWNFLKRISGKKKTIAADPIKTELENAPRTEAGTSSDMKHEWDNIEKSNQSQIDNIHKSKGRRKLNLFKSRKDVVAVENVETKAEVFGFQEEETRNLDHKRSVIEQSGNKAKRKKEKLKGKQRIDDISKGLETKKNSSRKAPYESKPKGNVTQEEETCSGLGQACRNVKESEEIKQTEKCKPKDRKKWNVFKGIFAKKSTVQADVDVSEIDETETEVTAFVHVDTDSDHEDDIEPNPEKPKTIEKEKPKRRRIWNFWKGNKATETEENISMNTFETETKVFQFQVDEPSSNADSEHDFVESHETDVDIKTKKGGPKGRRLWKLF